jgi:predicted NBD/HSP70 family sugar kinase
MIEGGGISRALRAVHAAGELTRSDLGAATGLNRSSVATIVHELIERGVVEEGAGASGGVGRPSLMVRAIPDSLAVIGWDVRADSTSAIVEGLGGRILHRWTKAHRRGSTDPYEVAARVVSGSSEIVEELPDHLILVGIGCALPGIVDPIGSLTTGSSPDGIVHRAPTLGWVDTPFGVILSEALHERFGADLPVLLGNDANLGAMAEWTRGAGRHSRVMVFVSGDVGIGGGVIVDGQPLIGATGFAGEIGHIRFDPQGSPCRCGARGCWETVIGLTTIVSAAGLDPLKAGIDDVLARASTGDHVCQAALVDAARAVGQGLASVVNMVNPDTIVLAGHLHVLLDNYRHTILEELRHTLSRENTDIRILGPSLGTDSIVVGASELVFEYALDRPQRWLGSADFLRSE